MGAREVLIVGAARTAIGTYGGALKEVPMTQVATAAVRAAVERSGVQVDRFGHVVMGNVVPTDPRDAYLSRVASLDARLPKEVPAFNVNRLCGSGLQAIVSAAQPIMLGDADVAIGGGDEAVRPDGRRGQLAQMKPVFKKDGLVTAGNSSGLNDGAAAVVLAEAGVARKLDLKPLARLVGYAHAGVDPEYMGIGPVPATRK